MQRSTTLSHISRKKNLSGADAGRALLICTCDSAKSGGLPTRLPDNVTDYINTQLPYSADDSRIYRAYIALCSYLSQQRSLADAHAMRLFGYIVSQTKTLEAGYAVENVLIRFANKADAEKAYDEKAPFVGCGIEAFIPGLYDGSDYMCRSAAIDAENFRTSIRIVRTYNLSCELIANETGVSLDPLFIDNTPFDEKTGTYNAYSEKLHALIEGSDTPRKAEKLHVLDLYFDRLPTINQIAVPEEAVNEARKALSGLAVFQQADVTLADLLMKEEQDA